MIDGIINVYKERGYTSHDVVAKLRGILRQKKIGHTGTLDPEAQGVLPVCLGKATKVCNLITDREKTYRAVLLLGTVTDTQDLTGCVLEQRPVTCSEDEVRACIRGFTGEQEQIPPMYSALKVGGRRLYELARKGIEVPRESRRIEIRELVIGEVRLPEITMTVTCSKGTYIRTLCHDIGTALGCGGCMKSLLRTKAGPFLLADSVTLETVERYRDEGRLGDLVIRTDAVFADLPALVLTEEAERLVRNGNPLGSELVRRCGILQGGSFPESERTTPHGTACPGMTGWGSGDENEEPEQTTPHGTARPGMTGWGSGDEKKEPEAMFRDGGQVRVYGADRTFLAIYEWRAQSGRFCAKTMFL